MSRIWYILSLGPQKLEPRVGDTSTPYIRSGPEYAAVQGGEGVIRLSLGRRLVNLLPVAQRTNALTYGNMS